MTEDPRVEAVARALEERYPELGEALFYSDIAATLAAADAAAWRPIEEAPRDGTWVQLYWPTMPITMYPAVGFLHDDEYGWEMVCERDYGEVQPTHFMPLPNPPH